MKKYDIVIGIDPDIDKSGVATIYREEGSVSVTKLAFPELIDYISERSNKSSIEGKSIVVCIEGGWLNDSNWHVPKGASGHYGAAIGESVGRNQAVGMLLSQIVKSKGIECIVIKPLAKTMRVGNRTLQRWKGRDGKITQEELVRVISRHNLHLYTPRMNQDQRDAVLIAMHIAGYQII